MIPKVRAWNTETKEIEVFKTYEEISELFLALSADEGFYSIMQSTGLKDKNGKEIFEGDIVDYKGRKAVVKWHGSFAGFIYRFIDESQERKKRWDPLFLAYLKFEVIGNIYKNPELLEVTE